jgi:hypothetical protein
MTLRSIVLLASSTVCAATAQAQAGTRGDSVSTVITSGQGKITLSPDRAVLRVLGRARRDPTLRDPGSAARSTVRALDERRWTTPWLTNGLADPRRLGLSPTTT